MNISLRASTALGLATLFSGFAALCYQVVAGDPRLRVDLNSDDHPTFEYHWLRQRLGTWVTPRENLDSPRFNDYRRTVPVMSPSEP